MTQAGTTSAKGAGTSINIDHELCAGTGACARALPEVFVVEDEGGETGKAYVRADVSWDGVRAEDVKAAAGTCPWAAIEVDD